MAIFLTILKIIGIILLSIIGLLLLIILTVLFVPIRYRITGYKKDDDYMALIRVSWLLSIIRIEASYFKDKGFDRFVKVLFIKVWPGAKQAEKKEEDKDIDKEDIEKEDKDRDKAKAKESVPDELTTVESLKEESGDNVSLEKETENSDKKYTFKTFYDKIAIKGTKIKNAYIRAEDKACYVKGKIDYLSTDEVKASIRLVLSYLGMLLRHIMPRKGLLSIKAGFDEPSTTGELLAIYSIFHPYLRKGIVFTPYFNQVIFDADMNIKGHVRLIIPVYILVKVYFNKELRSQFDKLME